VVASSEVLNSLNGGIGRRARRPFWVGAFAFLVLTAVVAVALVSVAIAVLATLRVAYTTSIDRVPNVTSSTDQRLTDRQSLPQTVAPSAPVVLPSEGSGRPLATTDRSVSTTPGSDLSPAETSQPAASAIVNPPVPDPSASARPVEDAAQSTLTSLIETQSPPPPAAMARSDGGDEGQPIGPAAAPAAPVPAGSGAVASAAPPSEPASSVVAPQADDIAATSETPETDEIGRLATEPLPIAVTAAALSHLRHVLKRRAQARAIKHTVHKPAPRPAPQANNFRPFDPFQPAAPSAAAVSARQRTW
jgi:hypothetical protein